MQSTIPQSLAMQSIFARRGTVLSEDLAVEIYSQKLVYINRSDSDGRVLLERRFKGHSSIVARIYNVSSKTIRDIWNHVTWKYATHHLWSDGEEVKHTPRPLPSFPTYNRPGRPKGSRDGKPRQRRSEPINRFDRIAGFKTLNNPITDACCQRPSGTQLFITSSDPQMILSSQSSNSLQPTSENQPQETGDDRCTRDGITTLPHDAPQQLSASFLQTCLPTASPSATCRTGEARWEVLPPSFNPVWLNAAEEQLPAGAEDDPFHGDWTFW
jgi:hypothetical protein